MKLSEQLKQDHESGDFGKALEGYAERAAALEEIVEAVAHIGVDWGCGEYAMIPTDQMVGKARELIDALKKKLAEEKAKAERLHKELTEYIRAEECIVAAGIVTQDKIKQAHELVQTFSR